MGGLEMMLKALGLNPEDLKARGDELKAHVERFANGMDALNAKQDRIEACLLRIENKMTGGLELPDSELAAMPREELAAYIDREEARASAN